MKNILFIILFLSSIVFTQDKVFIREYTYQASDYDSKVTARTNALNQVSELLLREVGVYIKSETNWDKTETSSGIEEIFEQKMDVITAGITRVEIIDEKWNWGEYWVKARVTLNPKDILKQIDALVGNQARFSKFDKLQKEKDDANKEIERLRKELLNVKSEKEQLKLSKSYNEESDKLIASDWMERGYDAYEFEADNEKAKYCFAKTIKLNPNHVGAYNNLGVIFKDENNYKEAKSYFKKAIKIDSKNPDSYVNLGLVYYYENNFSKAEKNYLKAYKINPNSFVVNFNLGILYYKLEKFLDAEKYYGKAVEINPNHFAANNDLGNVYEELGQRDIAEKFYLKAIELEPLNATVYKNLGILYHSTNGSIALKYYIKSAQLGDEGMQQWLKNNGYTW